MMPAVSVIVLVYKVEKYIERCARALFGQTMEDIEYVFVDDCTPDRSVLEGFLEVRDRLGMPLYLGETGENTEDWFAAMYPLALSLDIGVNVWPWKKLETKL